MKGHPEAPYLIPFGVLLALVGFGFLWPDGLWPWAEIPGQILRVALPAAALWWASRGVLDLRVRYWAGTALAGVLIFALWIAPDVIFPGYRQLLPFDNAIVGVARSSLSEGARHSPVLLALRTLRAVTVVPVAEELFWRGWLMRWIIRRDFTRVPLGAYQAASFWLVALLFASEHGPYWDVGLAAGVLLNLWTIRTKSLGDVILAHAIANLCLSGYVILAGKWEYWL